MPVTAEAPVVPRSNRPEPPRSFTAAALVLLAAAVVTMWWGTTRQRPAVHNVTVATPVDIRPEPQVKDRACSKTPVAAVLTPDDPAQHLMVLQVRSTGPVAHIRKVFLSGLINPQDQTEQSTVTVTVDVTVEPGTVWETRVQVPGPVTGTVYGSWTEPWQVALIDTEWTDGTVRCSRPVTPRKQER